MFWKKFWHNGKIQAELAAITKRLDSQEEIHQLLLKKLEETNQQGNKLLRMQYKTTQELLESQDDFTKNILMLEQLKTENNQLQGKNYMVVNCILEMLDDIDLTLAKLEKLEEQESGENNWQGFFHGWAKKIIEALGSNGIREIDLLGTGFDPLYAESIGTVTKEQVQTDVTEYCQIVDIYKRGFISETGTLLRKAQVITIADSEYENYSSVKED